MKSPREIIDDEELYHKLIEVALRFVSFRPRSEKEFKDFLLKKLQKRRLVDKSLIDRVVVRLRELGYVDDTKFVSWWIDQRESHRPKGARLIEQELKAKGVSDDLVKPLFVKCRGNFTCGRNENNTDHETVLAKRAVEKKLPSWRSLPTLEQKNKIYGFLGRRGFDAETIHRVIDEVVKSRVE